jgi:hypothetical protein
MSGRTNAPPLDATSEAFINAGDLKRHQKTHGTYGLMCPISSIKRHQGEGFKRKDNLREHLKRIHGMESEATAHAINDLASDGQSLGFDEVVEEGVYAGVGESMRVDDAVMEDSKSWEKSRLSAKLLELKATRVKWVAAITKLDGDIAAIERTLPLL